PSIRWEARACARAHRRKPNASAPRNRRRRKRPRPSPAANPHRPAAPSPARRRLRWRRTLYLLQAVLRKLAARVRVSGCVAGNFLMLMRASVVQPSDFWPKDMKDWASLSIASGAGFDLGYFLITSAKLRCAPA